MNRTRVRLLVIAAMFAAGAAAPARAEMVKAAPDSAAAPGPRVTDYSGYQSLLNDYVVVTSAKGQPLDTRFDYETLYDARGRRARMVQTGAQMFAVPPSRMSPRERLAWAINAYNFIVLDVVTENLLVPERGRLRHKTVQDMRILGGPLFKAPLITVEGKKYSLDEFERTFVFGGFQPALGAVPPAGFDPRPHFALVCAALGCPPLRPRVFRAESLEVQLDQATRNALRLPRILRFNPEYGLIEGSEIFNWYAADFGGHSRSLEFVKKYAPEPILAEIRKRKLVKIGAIMDWDWLLNQSEKKPAVVTD